MGCGPAAAFQCENDQDCLRGSAQPGVCQGVGYCSFPDEACESGQRFGEFSDALGNQCVPTDGSGSGGRGSDTQSETDSSSGFDTLASSGVSETTEPDTTVSGTTGVATRADDTGGDESSTGASPGTDTQPTASDLLLWIDFEPGPIDKSAYGHDVSCSAACPSEISGVFGAAGLFGGQHYEVDADAVLDLSGAFTLTLWARVDDMNTFTRSTLFSQEGASGEMSYDVSAQDLDGNSAYELVLASNGQGRGLLDQLPTGAWRFVAVRMDGGQQQVFVDGAEVSSGSLSPVGSTLAPVHIGGAPGIAFPLLGALDDLRLYARILSDEELGTVFSGDPLE